MASTLDHAFFYNSEDGDRIYDADSFEHWLKKFFTSGVFVGSCAVSADGSDMEITVSTGYANCDGKVRFFTEAANFVLATAHATYDRIDTIVVERNDSERDITIKAVTGAYSQSPQPTAPVRSNGIYQLVLAQIYVAAGETRIRQSAITDKRPDTEVCGYVASAVQTPDFSDLYAQFEAQAAEALEQNQEDFTTWFDEARETLSTDVAGQLLSMINTKAAKLSLADFGTISRLPAELTVTGVTAKHKVIWFEMSNPAAMGGDWTVTTSGSTVRITGSITGSTTLLLVLAETNT